MTIQDIIDPIPTEMLEAELKTAATFLRKSNKGGNELYVFEAASAPMLMREVGRLREVAFRRAGGGTGRECDIDEFDTMEPPCRQLIVWDPDNKLILGGYRFIKGDDVKVDDDGAPRIATAHLFRFSGRFMREYLPYTIELGRSFVRVEYQSSKAGAKALYVLDNLWDGLGALTVLNPEIRYLFGKVTMYPSYSQECRDMILYFLAKHFPDPDSLVTPIRALRTNADLEHLAEVLTCSDFKDDYRILNKEIRSLGYNIPPLVNAYMGLSPTMRMFGTAINDTFGDVEESGILLTISDIFEEKKRRHIASFHG